MPCFWALGISNAPVLGLNSLPFCLFNHQATVNDIYHEAFQLNILNPLFVLLTQTIEFDEGAGAVLRIQPLRAPRDENVYECVAENSEGEDSVQATLSIIRGKSTVILTVRCVQSCFKMANILQSISPWKFLHQRL